MKNATTMYSVIGFDENGKPAKTCQCSDCIDTEIDIDIDDLEDYEHPHCRQCGAGINSGLIKVRRNDSGCTCWEYEIVCQCGNNEFIQ